MEFERIIASQYKIMTRAIAKEYVGVNIQDNFAIRLSQTSHIDVAVQKCGFYSSRQEPYAALLQWYRRTLSITCWHFELHIEYGFSLHSLSRKVWKPTVADMKRAREVQILLRDTEREDKY